MRSHDNKVDALQAVPLFSDLSRRQLRELASVVDEVEVESGKTLMREGELARELLIVLTGHAEVSRGGRHLAEIGPGDAVGEIGLIDHGPRTATVVAQEPMELLSVSGRQFDHLREIVPGMTDALLKAAVRRLREADAIIAC